MNQEWSYHPYLQYFESPIVDDEDRLMIRGKPVEVRWVFKTNNFKEDTEDVQHLCGLAYDREGKFYGVSGESLPPHSLKLKIERLSGKSALAWFAKRASWDEAFSRELCRAIDNPEFVFMPLVSTRAVEKRKRNKKKAATAFYEQLHLATALVECVRKLEAEPTIENLSEACRSVSTLHQAMHQPENFKLAASA